MLSINYFPTLILELIRQNLNYLRFKILMGVVPTMILVRVALQKRKKKMCWYIVLAVITSVSRLNAQQLFGVKFVY